MYILITMLIYWLHPCLHSVHSFALTVNVGPLCLFYSLFHMHSFMLSYVFNVCIQPGITKLRISNDYFYHVITTLLFMWASFHTTEIYIYSTKSRQGGGMCETNTLLSVSFGNRSWLMGCLFNMYWHLYYPDCFFSPWYIPKPIWEPRWLPKRSCFVWTLFLKP